MMISTKTLERLPSIERLRAISRSVAMLDAILMPDWELRYYSFDSHWDSEQMMASMRDGGGNHYYALFTPHGAIIKGFDHESPMGHFAAVSGRPWPNVLDQVPSEFTDFLSEPAFSIAETTFCIWRRNSDASWKIGEINFPEGDDPDGSQRLLFIFDGDPQTYQKWAEGYYERAVGLDPVKKIYMHQPLSNELVASLNPEIDISDLDEDIQEIGYPLA